jgi:hypothetical protein
MSWGKGIVLAFIGFAAFIGVLVTVCVKQDVNLVSKDYYKEELNYQQQIDAMKNAAQLTTKPFIVVDQKHIGVSGLQRGELRLVRPSDSRFDASFVVDSVKTFDLSKYPSGRYNASLRWELNGKSFLIQEPINL